MDDKRIYHPLEMRGKKRLRSHDSKLIRIRTEHNNVGLIKGAMALLFVFLQLAIIISLVVFFVSAVRWYLIFCYVISLITAVYVLSSDRSAQSKAIWVLFILVAFIVGFVVFWLSEDRFVYRRARKRHHKIFKRSNCFVQPYEPPEVGDAAKADCRFLYNAGGFLPYGNSGVEYYPSGALLFDDVILSLEKAEKFIFIEFFIICDGVLLDRVWDILERKIKEGVEVRIIYDDMGTSKELSGKMLRKMKKGGAQIKAFNRLIARFSFAMNYRDHRKIIVADGKVAYTGGCNLADEYINEKRMDGYWKDTGIQVTGAAIDSLTITFLRQWAYIVKQPIEYARYLHLGEEVINPHIVVPYAGGPDYELPICKGIYENIIAEAKERIYIYTPYFVPDDSVTEALKNKALSGVDVRIVLPDIPDKFYVYMLTLDYAERLIRYGVKIYKMKDSFVHGKGVLTENCAVIGSANFDMRSFYQQFENGIYTDDPHFRSQVLEDFNDTFRECEAVEKPTRRPLAYRVFRGMLRIVSPLM